jgi:hypothetical protein
LPASAALRTVMAPREAAKLAAQVPCCVAGSAFSCAGACAKSQAVRPTRLPTPCSRSVRSLAPLTKGLRVSNLPD